MGLGNLVFFILLCVVSYKAYFGFYRVYSNIMLGRQEDAPIIDSSTRWRNVFLIAFGQKKMFANLLPAVLHFFIYTAFLLTQLELIEIIIDGLFGSHRFLSSYLGIFYKLLTAFIEILSFLALVATIIFLWRRNILRIPRFTKEELKGWPLKDANLILLGEILLVIGIFTMNAADVALQSKMPETFHDVGYFPISSMIANSLFANTSTTVLIILERFGWWLHVLVVLGFILYLPISKHLHIFLAFPNVYFAKLNPRGEMENMPAVMNEVKSMFGMEVSGNVSQVDETMPTFGAHDVQELSWKNILGAYTCTECGRCTAQCPANLTGKKLSPRKIMMDVRDRATEIGQAIAASKGTITKENFNDNKSLFDYISREEIRACTTCNACVEACPVMIDPLDIILKLRRYEVLTESTTAESWTPMFTSLENQGSVWQMSQSRAAWKDQ
jgi:heterodisulfide reductase subunit C